MLSGMDAYIKKAPKSLEFTRVSKEVIEPFRNPHVGLPSG